MQDAKKNSKRLRGKAKAKAGGSSEQKVERIQRLAKAIGNDEIKRRIAQGNVSRDMMMAYLCMRLQTVNEIQQREVQTTKRGSHWSWWRQVADDHKPWFSKPQPGRWAKTALLYEQAAKALAGGQLGRGKQILEKAMVEEQAQISKTSQIISLVGIDLESGEASTGLASEIVENAACGSTALPEDVKLAQEIKEVNASVPDPMNRRRRRDPWWTLEDEEEEEEEEFA